MARFYSNENFPKRVVEELRRLGHDVLTSYEAGRASHFGKLKRCLENMLREILADSPDENSRVSL